MSYYDYFSDEPESGWPEEEERCMDCGAYEFEAHREDCATRRLISEEDLNELPEVSDLQGQG